MAILTQNLSLPFSCQRPLYTLSSFPPASSPSPLSTISFPENYRNARKKLRICRAMVQQSGVVEGASSPFAKEMERLSAKESLLLALKDAGGFEALVTGRTTDVQRIDVNERIIALERLNPTPRPTTSPYLEGRWNFEWFGAASPAFLATRLLFGRIPPTLANLSKLDLLIRNVYGTAIAHVKLLNSIESKFVLSSKFSVEGPLRMKEEYLEGIFETPKVNDNTMPEQLRGALGQVVSTLQQLPVPIKDTVSSGLKIPLGEAFQRLIMISYLDEEILIVRNSAGEPEVLTRLDPAPDPEPFS
ncbi:PREDICTED: probable plastid-lipid-associated protein 13, chloroplastic [Nicotiana attenuata]|uniref:Plastid-lipid-associated protein 13, chloroplastic n=1 Tax=Nicotiana attenuata TaxID=49451 RepID=A0A1J6IEN0_NICAT|nr:PREDICTED: probable plastid-lipid-associated protein 13, chloroplastic [Nicotiana attenuata]OIT03517.1 putative plastid-lipid-associated protein 13, chloroplastic [Nicotiana attenuata]